MNLKHLQVGNNVLLRNGKVEKIRCIDEDLVKNYYTVGFEEYKGGYGLIFYKADGSVFDASVTGSFSLESSDDIMEVL